MAVTEQQVDSFHRFALQRLKDAAVELSIDDLYDEWRLQHMSPEERDENVLAVRAAIRDMQNGDSGQPAAEVLDEIRGELDPDDE